MIFYVYGALGLIHQLIWRDLGDGLGRLGYGGWVS